MSICDACFYQFPKRSCENCEHNKEPGGVSPSELSDLLACSECGKKSDDVVFCDMSNHPFYSKDDTEIPLCEKCYERLWDQI